MNTMDREEMRKVLPEPAAWLVTGGRTFVDRAYMAESVAEKSVFDRRDGARLEPLYTLDQLQAAMAHSCAGKAELVEALQEIAVYGTAWTHEGLVMITKDALSSHGG